MNNNIAQKKLVYLIKQFVLPNQWPTLRGILAHCEGDILYIKFYFSEKITDEIKENASILATEIIAQFPEAFLDEECLYLNDLENLASSPFWVYKKS